MLSATLFLCTLAGLGACNFNLTEQPLSSRIILDATFKPAPVFKNVNLLRSINLEKGFVRESINVQIENIHSKAQDEYYVPFSAGVVDRVGGLEVRDRKDPDKAGFEVALVEFDSFRWEVFTSTLRVDVDIGFERAVRPSSTAFGSRKRSSPTINRR